MARAITQNFAWAAAFVLSGMTFAGVLSFVFLAAPAKHAASSSDHGDAGAGDHAKADEHGDAHGKSEAHGEAKTDDHGAGHAKSKDHGTDAPGKPAAAQGEDEEISAKDFKNKDAPEASDHEAPHH